MILDDLIIKMVDFYAGDPIRIQHYIKVFQFAHVIGVKEELDDETQKILDITSILHDIGIRPAEEKYGSCEGKLQEKEGPQYAIDMLSDYNEVSKEELDRICYLIAHHHTYENVDGMDYRILLEADFLVNALEDKLGKDEIVHFRNKVFETKTGINLLNTMFGL